MFLNFQCDTPAEIPVNTLAMLTVAEAAAGLSPLLSRIVDQVGPKPMPSAPSTMDAANPASATMTRSFIGWLRPFRLSGPQCDLRPAAEMRRSRIRPPPQPLGRV